MGPVGFLGLALGLIVGVGGATGSWLGGWLADTFGIKDLRAYMVAPAIASLLTIPIYITAVTVDSAVLGILMLTANALLGTICTDRSTAPLSRSFRRTCAPLRRRSYSSSST